MSKFTNVNAEPTNEAKTKFAHFGLDDLQIAVLRDNGLKPEEIAGDQRTQAERVGELVRWFVRLADQAANPKWAVRHAFELAYYVATTDDRGAFDISAIRIEAYREGMLATAQDRSVAVVTGFIPAPYPDDEAVDRFAEAMKAKLAKKRAEGRGGWEDKDDCSNESLSQLLRGHVDKGDPVDVGNLAMMIHQRNERIAVSPQPAAVAVPEVAVVIEEMRQVALANEGRDDDDWDGWPVDCRTQVDLWQGRIRSALTAAPSPASEPAPPKVVEGATEIPDTAIAAIWTAAMTAATNIIVKRQNDLNDDDGPMQVLEEQDACIRALKTWLEADEVYLDELRHIARAVLASQEKKG